VSRRLVFSVDAHLSGTAWCRPSFFVTIAHTFANSSMEGAHNVSHPSSSTQPSDSSPTNTDPSLESTRLRAEVFRRILDEVEGGRLDATSLSLRLQEAGASPNEAKDYLDQLQGNFNRQLVMCKARPQAVSRPSRAVGSPGRGKPSLRAWTAQGLGLTFFKPRLKAQAVACHGGFKLYST
jgi:hypothetical protein